MVMSSTPGVHLLSIGVNVPTVGTCYQPQGKLGYIERECILEMQTQLCKDPTLLNWPWKPGNGGEGIPRNETVIPRARVLYIQDVLLKTGFCQLVTGWAYAGPATWF